MEGFTVKRAAGYNQYQRVAASLLVASGGADLLMPATWLQRIFQSNASLLDEFKNIASIEDLQAFVQTMQEDFGLSVALPEPGSIAAGDTLTPAGKDGQPIGPPISLLTRDEITSELKPHVLVHSLPGNDVLNPAFFSKTPPVFVDPDNAQAIFEAVDGALTPRLRRGVQQEIEEAQSREDHAIHLAVLDYFPDAFQDGSALTPDGSTLEGMALVKAQNRFLQEATRTYMQAEAKARGTGLNALLTLTYEHFPGAKFPRDYHGIIVAVEALESYQSRAQASGTQTRLNIVPVPDKLDDMSTSPDKEAFVDRVMSYVPAALRDGIAAWNISLGSTNSFDRDLTEHFLNTGTPVFSASGNRPFQRHMDGFQPPEAVVVGGHSCLSFNVGTDKFTESHTGIIDDDTDIALNEQEPGECSTITIGTSSATSHVAGTYLAERAAISEAGAALRSQGVAPNSADQAEPPRSAPSHMGPGRDTREKGA